MKKVDKGHVTIAGYNPVRPSWAQKKNWAYVGVGGARATEKSNNLFLKINTTYIYSNK
jgi:hypothetical protein